MDEPEPDLERLRARCEELQQQVIRLARDVVTLCEQEAADREPRHRKPPRHLRLVKAGLVAAGAWRLLVRRPARAGVTLAAASTVALTAIAVPYVLRMPPPFRPHAPLMVVHRRAVRPVAVPSPRATPGGRPVPAAPQAVSTPAPVPTVTPPPFPDPKDRKPKLPCVIRILRICI